MIDFSRFNSIFELTNYFSTEDKCRYSGGDKVSSLTFRDERKARDYYTDMLLRYPDYNVELLKSKEQ